MRKELYRILDVEDDASIQSKTYNVVNILMIVISVIPLLFKEQTITLLRLEIIAVVFFSLDYIFRFLTADFKFPEKKSLTAFVSYPFAPFAIIDLLSILPSLTFLNQSFRLFRLLRLSRSLRVFRTFKLFRYSKSFELLIQAIKKQKDSLMLVGGLIIIYIFVAALLVFNVEPQTFPTFMDALNWATSSLTTVTYGDVYPTSTLGQLISMLSNVVGVIIIALPTSIITAGYIEELEDKKLEKLKL
ncbi:ion transporter [Alkalibacterium sp. f15]|uniref:ion transporter n=1 Tax=Alkalibacterium sp. f15 TaxID=3414029 RepID=UPI003BF7B102